MSKSLLIIFFLNQSLVLCHSSDCPESHVVFPCICSQANQSLPDLTCSRNDFDMSDVIKKIRLSGRSNAVQTFDKLFWTNGQEINITDDFFDGISFQRLFIGTQRQYANVLHISSRAFRGIGHNIQSIVIRSKHLEDEHQLFDALRRLTNVESIAIEGMGLRTVPMNAFKTPEDCEPLTDCLQKRLKTISFRFGVNESLVFLNEIQSNAFYDLPNLRSLDLSSHDISHIQSNAFTFGHKSDHMLTIDLSHQWNRQLVPHSFQVNAFEATNRPILLDLFGNKFLTTLPEQVFRPLLTSDARNRIRLGVKMDCDCHMLWLWRERHRFVDQFIEWSFDELTTTGDKFTILCSKGVKDFWLKNETDFNECLSESRNEL